MTRFQNPTLENALEYVVLNNLTSIIEELMHKQADIRKEKATKKRVDEAAINAKAKKTNKNSLD